jgi:hypothetical protein
MYICVNLVRNKHEKISDIWYGLKSFCEELKLTVYVDYTGKRLSLTDISPLNIKSEDTAKSANIIIHLMIFSII